MNRHLAISCGVSFAAVLLGIAATLRWGADLPVWLLTTTLSLVMLLALAYGFTSALPRFEWLKSRAAKGAALVCLGVAAIFVPLSFVIAAFCIGYGTRLVWETACLREAGASPWASEPSGRQVVRPRQACAAAGPPPLSARIAPAATAIARAEDREWELDVDGR